jgi:hypothetical protein
MTRRSFTCVSLSALLRAQQRQLPEAFDRLYNLDFDTALGLFEQDCRREPRNPDHFNNYAYGLLYRALFRADALEGGLALSVGQYLRRPKVPFGGEQRQKFHEALSRAEAAARGLGETPESVYALGVAQTHRANLSLLVDKEWRAALEAGGEARKLHSRVLELQPGFIDALLVPSLHEYIVGSLPFYVRVLGFLVGFSGEKVKGIEGLRKVAAKGQRARIEAQVLLALVEHREDRPERGVEIMKGLVREFPTNHLYRREAALLLLASKRRDEARREMEALSRSHYPFLKPQKLEDYRRDFEVRAKA